MTTREPCGEWEPYGGGWGLSVFDGGLVGTESTEWGCGAWGLGMNSGPFDTEDEAKIYAEDHAVLELAAAICKLRPNLKPALDALLED